MRWDGRGGRLTEIDPSSFCTSIDATHYRVSDRFQIGSDLKRRTPKTSAITVITLPPYHRSIDWFSQCRVKYGQYNANRTSISSNVNRRMTVTGTGNAALIAVVIVSLSLISGVNCAAAATFNITILYGPATVNMIMPNPMPMNQLCVTV